MLCDKCDDSYQVTTIDNKNYCRICLFEEKTVLTQIPCCDCQQTDSISNLYKYDECYYCVKCLNKNFGIVNNNRCFVCDQFNYLYLYDGIEYCNQCLIDKKTNDMCVQGICIKCDIEPVSDMKFCIDCLKIINNEQGFIRFCLCNNWFLNKCSYCDSPCIKCIKCDHAGFDSQFCNECI